ncbi:hypothetical protein GWI72_12150 [Microvirga tunisiensis]|uniref:Uncharacterized protein n=2 Tax=Pannonibacter tanglangensis TaxID=2750084 RepID=A0ABW9ZHZ5_9HYPH|nr:MULTISPECIES: hypothetical protein [unclassified Pannonibacter]NBN64489.1 hypothetical protein [Pannonibacter sp. XCT-34]NBN79021.1 hypothetical protein [Pannonibacter sp. XCT-53]
MSKENVAVTAVPQIVVSGVLSLDLGVSHAHAQLTASEFYVLQRMRQFKLRTAITRPLAPLSADEREARVEDQLALWESGCSKAIDEGLYADLERRAKQILRG